MNEQLISHIEELGLSNKEARVYVACLLTGPAAVQRIADQSGIKRVTTYVILESLVGLGLVAQSIKGKKTLFIAEQPVNLRRLLDKRAQELREQQASFDAILPELTALTALPSESPNVKFFDSAEGIKSVMSNFLAAHRHEATQGIYGISNLDQLYSAFPEFRENGSNPSRKREGIRSRFLYTSKEGPIFRASDESQNRESRWVPFDKYPINGDISIVGNHIIMLSLAGSKPLSITIDSRELALGMTVLFEMSWAASEPYNLPIDN